MQMQAFLWLFLPLFVAGGSAMLAYYIMQARMEVALAKEREALAEARATIDSHKVTMEERIKATEEAARRAALDELMHDIRVEERSYVRDSNTPDGARRSMVMQERVFFRNLPMSSWSEREMVIEEGPANSLSARTENFEAPVLTAGPAPSATAPVAIDSRRLPRPVPPAPDTRIAVSKTLEPVVHPAAPSAPLPRRDTRTLVAAFGAQ
ncbi:MAG: hypothetical protein ABIR70_16605 [Bryobacteraceae bacterium]